jgi:hypothetical protein
MNVVVRDYKIKKLKSPIPARAAQQFYSLVEDYLQKVEQAPPLEE